MKTKLFLSLAMLFSLSSAHAAVDNQIDINLSATVARSCLLDLAPAAEPSKLSDNKVMSLQLSPREAAASDVISIPVFETCNEDFKITLKSANGGMKHASSAFVKSYEVKYHQAGGEFVQQSSALSGAGMSITKTVAQWRAEDPVNHTEGMTPSFEQRSLILTAEKEADLPKGEYADVLTLEMSSVD